MILPLILAMNTATPTPPTRAATHAAAKPSPSPTPFVVSDNVCNAMAIRAGLQAKLDPTNRIAYLDSLGKLIGAAAVAHALDYDIERSTNDGAAENVAMQRGEIELFGANGKPPTVGCLQRLTR